ncbi:MAG TPA: GTPase Era, partial [Calditrichia bacterium]|nr:GTPase Era [Calditrichia bacterium]
TLLNQLLQYKLSIVTRKPQTTRRNVIGIHNEPGAQAIFMDTPGLINPRYNLQEAMMRQVQSAIKDADLILYLVDCADKLPAEADIQAMLKPVACPVILGFNKIDLIDRRKLLPLIETFGKLYPFRTIIPLSAEKNDGVDQLLREVVKNLPQGPPYYPSDYITDQQERFFVAEIIREKIFKFYGQEVPYATHVDIEEFKERENGKVYVRAVIFIERDSQKSIIIGKKGQALKKVGQLARQEIEVFLDRPIFLELFVKVSADWRKQEAQLRRMGYLR